MVNWVILVVLKDTINPTGPFVNKTAAEVWLQEKGFVRQENGEWQGPPGCKAMIQLMHDPN